MAVSYRNLLTDFSAGELDPLIELNINSGLRNIGVKESLNTIHLPSGAIRKRPPSFIANAEIDNDNNIQNIVELLLPLYTINIIFKQEKVFAYILERNSSLRTNAWPLREIELTLPEEIRELDRTNSHFAVYQNQFVEVNKEHLPILYSVNVDKESLDITLDIEMMKDEEWNRSSYPSACCFAQGRLGLCYGNIVVFSRTPLDGENRFFDFTLSDNEYTYKVEIDLGAIDDNKSALVSYTLVSNEKLEEEELTPKGIEEKYKAKLTKRVIEVIDNSEEEKKLNELDDEGERKTVSISKKRFLITTNYLDGLGTLENVLVDYYYKDEDKVITESTNSYDNPESIVENSIVKGTITNPTTRVLVYSDHAVEVEESDLYTSEIQWIANLGRIVVATKTAIFIATSDIISPSTFDLTPTSNVGSCSMQPKVMSSWLILTSLDRHKLYGAIYSNEIQGLQITEITQNVHHMFASKIKQIELTDTPSMLIYALTENGSLYCGSVIPYSSTILFSWSKWSLPNSLSIELIAFDRTVGGTQTLLAMTTRNNKPVIIGFNNREVYNYGSEGIELYMDFSYKVEGSINETNLPAIFTKSDKVEVAYYFNDDKLPRVDRHQNLETLLKTDDIETTEIGITYPMEVSLFTPLMPNQSGLSLQSYHSVQRINVLVYKSLGGSIRKNGSLISNLKQSIYGHSLYSDSFIDIDPDSLSYKKPYSFTGLYGVDEPVANNVEDNLSIYADEPYPLNIKAIELLIKLTEVN